jgi:CRP-like cAMP-binding protein
VLPKFATKRFKAGETVFRKGDAGDLFYVIQSDQVEIIDETNGTEKKIRELAAND